MTHFLSISCLAISLTSMAVFTDWNVPGDFSSIQSAIANASDGDTVSVSPGTYVENINFLGKDIWLRSTGGPATTIIDGGRMGTVVLFMNGESSAARLEGFTIRNGLGQFDLPTGLFEAGGITCYNSSPEIVNCIVRENEGASGIGYAISAGPGGVLYRSANGPVPALLEDCVVELNQGGDMQDQDAGDGGVSARNGAFPTIRRCVIRGNIGGDTSGSVSDVYAGTGGIGLKAAGQESLVTDCLIEGNQGGANLAQSSYAGDGGITIRGSRPTITRCVIKSNVGGPEQGAESGDSGTGGIGAHSVRPGCRILSCLIVGNQGGAAAPEAGVNDVGGAGGIRAILDELSITNCTITLNVGGSGDVNGTGGFQSDTHPDEPVPITNCIVWGNVGAGPGDGNIRLEGPPAPIVSYSLIGDSGYPGVGNFGGDPGFVDSANGDFHLVCDSPAIDSGTRNEPTVPTHDLDGDPRLLGDEVDVGADEVVSPDVANYCISVPNSSGNAAVIDAGGCGSVAANGFTVAAEGVPNTPGLFFYGPNQIQVSFGDGFRCVGGAIRRLPPSQSMGGVLQRTLNLPNTLITGGSVWNFQAWFRDPAAGGAGFNLSDGLQVSFEP